MKNTWAVWGSSTENGHLYYSFEFTKCFHTSLHLNFSTHQRENQDRKLEETGSWQEQEIQCRWFTPSNKRMVDREARAWWRDTEILRDCNSRRPCLLTSRPGGAGEELTPYKTQISIRAVDREGCSHNRHPSAVGEQEWRTLRSFLGPLPLAQPKRMLVSKGQRRSFLRGVSLLRHTVGQIKVGNDEGTREDAERRGKHYWTSFTNENIRISEAKWFPHRLTVEGIRQGHHSHLGWRSQVLNIPMMAHQLPLRGAPLAGSLRGGIWDVERGCIFAIKVWVLCHRSSIQDSTPFTSHSISLNFPLPSKPNCPK